MFLPSRIFGATVGQASLPILSRKIAKNKLVSFRKIVNKTLLQSYFIALPITTIMLMERVPLVRLAFGSKQFPWAATLLTAKTLAFLTPAIASQALIQILIRCFYAMHDTRTPLKISTVSLIVNIITGYVVVTYTDYGIVGLAMSVSLANIAQCLGLLIFFSRKVRGFAWDQLLPSIFKITLASVLMGIIMWGTIKISDIFILDTAKTFHLLILFIVTCVIGSISYLVISLLLKIKEASDLKTFIVKMPGFIFRK
jgi:putative peptidoglycan lipid II flippase